MAACQQIKWSPGGTQQLTYWMKFHGCMSANQMKPRRHTATHKLDGISWLHISNSNGAQEAHSNSLPGWNFHSCMLANQAEPRGHIATHILNGVSWLHVSNSNGGQEAHSNSLSGWSFIAACQKIKWSPGGTQQLTAWMEFHGCMLANQMEPRRHTTTDRLDGIFMAASQHIKWSPGGTQQLTDWMEFHGCISAIQMEPRGHTATHILDKMSWLHVSNWNGVQKTHSNWLPVWSFMAASQQLKWSPGGTQQLTPWMEFHGWMSAIQMEGRRHIATHSLDGVSWLHVSKSSGAQEAHSNSLPGWSFMAASQQIKWSPGDTEQLTYWMEFHSCMSATQMQGRRHTAAHSLDGISWLHISQSSGAQKAHSNSQSEWNFIAACQQIKWSPGGTQQLTDWINFHGCKSAIEMEPRRHTATHSLDGVLWLQVSNWNGAQEAHSNSLPGWNFHGYMSANQVEPGRHTATHFLDGVSWLHVSKSSGAQEAHSNSQTGWSFMAACQQIKWSPGDTQQLTYWMEFYGCMLANQMEPRNTQQLTYWMEFHGCMLAI